MIRSKHGEIERVHWLVGAIIVGYLLFNLGNIKISLFGYNPKNIPLIEASELKSMYSSKPTFVYFYHKLSDDTPKQYFPVLDELAERYAGKVNFYRYQHNADYQKEEFKDHWSNQSTLVMLQNGKETKSAAASLGNPKFLPRGFAFKFLKDSVIGATPISQRSDLFIKPEEFEKKVLGSLKPVVVNFTCDTCPAARMLEPHYKQIALENAGIADFYMVDTNDAKNSDILSAYGTRATPTMVLFYNGKKCLRQTGAYSQKEPNEALILGMISKYL